MHLTVDLSINTAKDGWQQSRVLSRFLGLANLQLHEKPLEAMLAEDFGLQSQPDYPLAAISASADGVKTKCHEAHGANVVQDFWLRADPVHLVMQRDAFSLGEPVPLVIDKEATGALIDTLNIHFAPDGLHFVVGTSGAWYVKTTKMQRIQTTLPELAVGQNVHHLLPQGLDAARWRAVMNEIQMIFHDHPVNLVREQNKEPVVNSVWFSGGGVMPIRDRLEGTYTHILADAAIYVGLAQYAQTEILPTLSLKAWLADVLKHDNLKTKRVRLRLKIADESVLNEIMAALNTGKIQTLTLNIGFYAHTLVAQLSPWSRAQWWRKTFWRVLLNRPLPTVLDYFKALL